MADGKRLNWIDAAKGISIILVVMMYAGNSVGKETGDISYLRYIIGFATPFRMPEFFLISGLFLSQVIARPWVRFADRRAVHYMYFYAIWMLIHVATKTVLGGLPPIEALSTVAISIVEPYGVLWFIYMLAVFSIAAKVLWELRAHHMIVVPIAIGLQMLNIKTGSYALNQFAEYFIYFYLGYIAAPFIFKFVAWFEKRKAVAIASFVAWALINGAFVFSPGFEIGTYETQMGLGALPGVHFLLAVAGGLAILVAASLLAPLASMKWLNWVGAHSIVIYLSFALPMAMVREVLIKLGIVGNIHMLSTIVFGVAMISPVILYYLINKTGWGKFLFTRPAWASFPGTRAEKPNKKPTHVTIATPAE
ncbi:MAG: acyltransferase family protein [Devosiaceae bacterium]|nr:acyltransferase family protein [Devosiaceae bacterium]